MMNRVFISHPYSDNPELRLKQNDYICRNLSDEILPISPLHLFAFEYDDSRREEILQVCFDLIDMCDEVWFYNYNGLSKGQICELHYAMGDKFIKGEKPPNRCIQMEKKNEKYEKNIDTLKKMTTNYKLQRELMEPVNEGWI